jgi:hypothetical protein
MLTQTSPDSLYLVTASLELIGPTEKIINEPKRLTRLKNCLSGLPLKIDLHTTPRGDKQLLFTAAPRSFSVFTRLARQLAAESTAFITTLHIRQPARTLTDLNPDDWVIFSDTLPARVTHDSNTLHAARIPAGLHFISRGTGVSTHALAWLTANLTATFDSLPLKNVSPVHAENWFLLAPHHFLGHGLDHPWLPQRNAAQPATAGLPRVTLGISPSEGVATNRYPIDQKKLHQHACARIDARITDPALIELAQVTLWRTLTLSAPTTLLRSQIPANTDIAWFCADGQSTIALKARAANALIAAGLATPDLFTTLSITDTPPPGSHPITDPPPAANHPLAHRKTNAPSSAAPASQEKITNPTVDHAAKALADFVAIYRPPASRAWRPRSRKYPQVQNATLPANWVALAALPGSDGLIANILQNSKHFKGAIENPAFLPPYSRLIEVATDGSGDTFILIAPPDAPSLSSLGQVTPGTGALASTWLDCPVAWHEGGRIACIWPSVAHFALDRIAQHRRAHEEHVREQGEDAT